MHPDCPKRPLPPPSSSSPCGGIPCTLNRTTDAIFCVFCARFAVCAVCAVRSEVGFGRPVLYLNEGVGAVGGGIDGTEDGGGGRGDVVLQDEWGERENVQLAEVAEAEGSQG